MIGGFGETTVEEAEKLAHDLLKHVQGFHEVSMVDSNSIVGIAQFDTSANAMKFVRSLKKYPQIQTTNCGWQRTVVAWNGTRQKLPAN